MLNLTIAVTDPSSLFLKDWAMTYLVGGSIITLFGIVVGWMIWRFKRRVLESVEEQGRQARVQYEQIHEELDRLKNEISDPRT